MLKWLDELLNDLFKPKPKLMPIPVRDNGTRMWTPEERAAVQPVGQPAPLKKKPLAWDGKHKDAIKWTVYLDELVSKSVLPDLIPLDLVSLIPQYKNSREDRIYVWCQIISKMAERESNFKPETAFEESGNLQGITSRGLLQISFDSANNYGAKLEKHEDLHDPKTNLRCGVLILSKWVSQDNCFVGGSVGNWKGGSRYWSVLRDSSRSKPVIMGYLKTIYDVHNLETHVPKSETVPKEGIQIPKTKPYPTYAVVEEAQKWIGVTESGGNNRGPEVERFQKAVDGKARGEPWCAAFTYFCAKEAAANHGYKLYLYPTEHCVTLFAKTKPENKITVDEMIHHGHKPEPGWLVVWQTIGASTGHVGIVKSIDLQRKRMVTIEGNTDSQDGINRDGNGVFEKVQDLDGYGNKKLLGFIRTVSA